MPTHPFYIGVPLGIEAQFKYAAFKMSAFQVKENEAHNNSIS